MQNTSTELTQQKQSTLAHLPLAIALAMIVATIADLIVYFLVPALSNIVLEVPLRGSALQPLPVMMVILACVVSALGGGLLLATLNRFTSRPIMLFRMVAGVVWLLSLVPLFGLPVPAGVAITLASMHTLTAAIITYILTTQSSGDLRV
jgi:hypothetical protein